MCHTDDVPRAQIETLTPRAVIFDHKGKSERPITTFLSTADNSRLIEEFGNTASVLAQSADLDYEDVTNTTALWLASLTMLPPKTYQTHFVNNSGRARLRKFGSLPSVEAATTIS